MTSIYQNYKNLWKNFKGVIYPLKVLTGIKSHIIQHGLKLRIVDKPVTNYPFEHPRSIDERAIIDGEIQKLLRKRYSGSS